MTPKQFKEKYDFCDEDINIIKSLCKIFYAKEIIVLSIEEMEKLRQPKLKIDFKSTNLVKGYVGKTTKSRSFYRGSWKRTISV